MIAGASAIASGAISEQPKGQAAPSKRTITAVPDQQAAPDAR